MILSGTIAYRILPAWMYHAQVPPPTHTHNPNLPGLTWVDLVFPLFLFSMGAAIPLALSRRIAKKDNQIQLILYILKRGFFLGTFAIVLEHLRPTVISQANTPQKWIIALWGFLLLFFMFVRLPDSLPKWQRTTITMTAWVSAIILLSQLRYPDGSGFSLDRSDIILIVLTNTAVFGSLVWLFTKSNLWLRLGFLALLFAVRLSATVGNSWIGQLWSTSPIPWIFQFAYLSYLFVVIPGTIAGDLILNWLHTNPDADAIVPSVTTEDKALSEKLNRQWPKNRFYCIILLLLFNCLALLVGLQTRWVWQTTLLSGVICWLCWFFFSKPSNETEYLIKNFYKWGVYWLFLGLFFEPFQGGLKKDPATFSYYFVTVAMAFFILIIFTVIIDIFKYQKPLQILIYNGQNPMIAYVGFANLVWPILVLSKIDPWVIENTKAPWLGFLKGVIYTLIVACIVSIFTKQKIFWRT
ncbi:DUF5009 domain-containing protein [Planktothrix sp. FACHB-1355]|uniref:DUF5009 domain-containing protein n=2 Tax=Cyanophyceae TaxID=3028117 RepID=A0A926ZHT1_9CYAN|nr:DUF5009 domain-containing protein [Aerosakkonema funiforme FACHB-1375]MBD3559241.1 DUF5009 domain-containing protein [Planktothrix sp. FACHB-1355]